MNSVVFICGADIRMERLFATLKDRWRTYTGDLGGLVIEEDDSHVYLHFDKGIWEEYGDAEKLLILEFTAEPRFYLLEYSDQTLVKEVVVHLLRSIPALVDTTGKDGILSPSEFVRRNDQDSHWDWHESGGPKSIAGTENRRVADDQTGMDPIAREWVDRVLRAVQDHDDLIDVGPELAKDHRLSQGAYEEALRELSKSMWGNGMTNLLSTAIDLRAVPRQEFWRDIIIYARDDELGMKLLHLLLPYLDLTSLLCDLIAVSPTATTDQKRRIANTLWSASCGATLSLPTMDRFHMKEAIDVRVVRTALQKALPTFDCPTDRDKLQAALAALSRNPT